MPEMKRVDLSSAPSSQKQKKVKWKQDTHRFVLTLGESNSTTCPEYSFSDLIQTDRKQVNGDLFGDLDDDRELAAIAQRFEAKYGPKGFQSGKRKRTQEMDDFCDLGDGYDEDDPFIDNTEAYDEVIPSTMTTQHGGFYINQGKLDFKCLDEDSSEEFVGTSTAKKKKKQVLDSESEDESGAAIAKKFLDMKRKKQRERREGEKLKKMKPSNSVEGEVILKKKKIKNLEKKKVQKSLLDTCSQKDVRSPASLPSTLVPPAPTVTSRNTENNADKVASMPNGLVHSDGSSPGKGAAESLEALFITVPPETMDDSSSKSEDEGKGENQYSERNSQLPAQLPTDLMEAIDKLKQEAKETKEKKLKFFSAEINQLLLNIELGCCNLPWGSKTAIYNHLGEHLPCGKHTLQRRAKKLRESLEEDQLKSSTQKLKEAIMKVMPGLEEQHEADVQKAKMDSAVKEENTDLREEASTESEEEEKIDGRKKPRGPRKKFQWNMEIRNLLLDIVSTKMKLYSLCKSRNQSAEEYLKAFLDSDIKPMWPQGWMQTRMLFKESRSAHEDVTKAVQQQPVKQKKVPAVAEAPASNQEHASSHVSRTEDVIEISSTVESDDERNSSAITIVDLTNSDSKLCTGQVCGTPATQAAQTSVSNTFSSSINNISKQSFKATTATSSTCVMTSSQKTVDNSAVTTVKRITPIAVSPHSLSLSQKNLKSLTSEFMPNAASTLRGLGSDHQVQVGTHLRSPHQRKTLSLQHKSSSQQQHNVNFQQQKLPQETNLQQNSAAFKSSSSSSSSMVVSKDSQNSSWSNKNSHVLPGKHINPVVAVNRIPETFTQKISGSRSSNNTMLQQDSATLPQNQQLNSEAASKLHDAQKKWQQGSSSTTSNISSEFEPQTINKPAVSSKQDSQSKSLLQQNQDQPKPSSIPSPQVKSGAAIIASGSSQNTQQQLSRSHVVDLTSQTISSSPGGARDQSPPSKPSSSTALTKPSLLAASAPLPPSSAATELLSLSLSRSNTPSPQKSPASPDGNAGRKSLYEQITSRLFHQEAMEDQALKNLAMAKFGGGGFSPFF